MGKNNGEGQRNGRTKEWRIMERRQRDEGLRKLERTIYCIYTSRNNRIMEGDNRTMEGQ